MSEQTLDTLFELLDEYQVEVPIVQRDYAQGRQDTHAETVRSNLLIDMRAAILEETQPLDLNFVYGKAEGKKFIPIDGQQRLTTLFLLHLYAFRNDETKTPILHKFTYETRITSREFLKKLIENRADVFAAGTSPSEEIEDSEWFVSDWMHDPTIRSALVMLDDIQATFGDIDHLAEKMIGVGSEPLVFKFFEMQDLGMEDSLYIKLNARGKPLTEFENFKARLLSRMKKLELSYIDKFELCFDRDWTDLFWAEHKEDFDQTYYAFFGVLLMNNGIIQDDKNWANTLDYSKISAEVFETAFYTLNFLCENHNYKDVSPLIFSALTEGRTYANRVLFHAVTTYLFKAKGIDNGSLKQWLRIIKNLTLNSTIDVSNLYRNTIESINVLAENWDTLLAYFSTKGKVIGFNQQQIAEEQEKAQIIIVDMSFAQEIYKAEQHRYFSGQIRSALYLAKSNDGKYEKEQFIKYWDKISALFDDAKPRHGHLLRCALLTFGDYTLPVSQFKTLCVDDPNEAANTPSLKSLFANCGNVVRQLLDTLNPNTDIQAQLKGIIAKLSVSKKDWRYCLIHYPQLFKWMSVSHLRLRVLQNEMHLIQNKWSNGYNYVLFLSALHEELKNRNLESLFDGELGIYVQHYLYVNGYTISFSNGKFNVTNGANKIVFESQSDDPISETAEFLSK
ncbi:DUF262 domain-containing protein [Sporolactobacillus laevolacticus]|uniref:GmrSD restriction endonucleases N-terminal domain-containing protein n=1 Tax=Sporolactobacillus laevolacticus DSM 442 TaxID=1395513 RepID=V6J2D7_9BACL|nr:DUF262 domain-containing protein [Sporolactobacillus laevolacticus]EST10924.1 hypothetical protein P343_14565 [Sporolactobacillus laevolacticus DSM 442]